MSCKWLNFELWLLSILRDSRIWLTQIYLLCVWYSFIFVSKNSLKHHIRIGMELLSPLEKLLAYGLSPCCIISSIFFSWIGSIFQFWSYFISISSQLNPGKWSYPFIRRLIRTVLQTSGDQRATHAINNSESDSRGLHKVRTKGVLTKNAESLKGNWRSFVQYASDNFAANHASKMHRFHPKVFRWQTTTQHTHLTWTYTIAMNSDYSIVSDTNKLLDQTPLLQQPRYRQQKNKCRKLQNKCYYQRERILLSLPIHLYYSGIRFISWSSGRLVLLWIRCGIVGWHLSSVCIGQYLGQFVSWPWRTSWTIKLL